MDTWNTFNLILLLILGLGILFFIVLHAVDYWREHKAKGQREIRVARSRGPTAIMTPWGIWYLYAYRRISESELHVVLRDRNKRRHELDIHAHELKPMNPLQVAVGPGNPLFLYVPGSHSPKYAETQFQSLRTAGIIHTLKAENELLSAEAKAARISVKQSVRDNMEQINDAIRARTPAQKK